VLECGFGIFVDPATPPHQTMSNSFWTICRILFGLYVEFFLDYVEFFLYMKLYSHRNAADNRHIIKHREKNIHKKYDGNDMTI